MTYTLPERAILGMVHTLASPGSPSHNGQSVKEIAEHAANEARVLMDNGCTGVVIENMHDTPYLRRKVGPEVTATLTACAIAARTELGPSTPIGLQILAGANTEALAVAHAANLNFIRAEGFAFAHVADEGIFDTADAPQLLRYRKAINATNIAVYTDIKKKHASHAITADIDITENAKAAAFMGAQGVIVTGSSTGQPASLDDVQAVKPAGLTVLVGSGITPDSIAPTLAHANGVIVGSYLKQDGHWANPIDPERVRALVAAANQ